MAVAGLDSEEKQGRIGKIKLNLEIYKIITALKNYQTVYGIYLECCIVSI